MEWVISLGVSVAVVVLLVACARWLKLGPAPQLGTCEAAQAVARFDEFFPVAIALAADGSGALARDAAGRWLLIRRHGVHWVTRVLDGAAVTHTASGQHVVLSDGQALDFPPAIAGPFDAEPQHSAPPPLSKAPAPPATSPRTAVIR